MNHSGLVWSGLLWSKITYNSIQAWPLIRRRQLEYIFLAVNLKSNTVYISWNKYKKLYSKNPDSYVSK